MQAAEGSCTSFSSRNISTESGPNMANQVLHLWETVLANLAASAAASGSNFDLHKTNTHLCNKIRNLPDPPKATWKRIVQDMQVRDSSTRQHSSHAIQKPS
jgi:hypothetical protein